MKPHQITVVCVMKISLLEILKWFIFVYLQGQGRKPH